MQGARAVEGGQQPGGNGARGALTMARPGTAVLAAALALVFAAPAGAQQFAFEFGAPGGEAFEGTALNNSAAVDADGNPWVASGSLAPGGTRIFKFDYNGNYVADFTSFGDVPVVDPVGIGADDQGFLYIAQRDDEPRIAKIDTGGVLIDTIRLRDRAGGVLWPNKIDVDDSGRLYVSDATDTVYRFSASGERRGEIRLPAGQTVNDVAVDDDGEIFISFNTSGVDEDGVARYGADLRPIDVIGPFTNVSLQELEIDPAGRVNVADYRNSIVHRFDQATGDQIDTLGTKGIGVGQTNGPEGVAIDCRGNLYVLDAASAIDDRPPGKVVKFAVPGPPPPCAPRALPAGAIDTQINDVEVTQSVQPPLTYTAGPMAPPGQLLFSLPETEIRTRAYGTSTGGVPSGEVPLKAALTTVVRVYANLNQGPAGGIANVPATLEGVTADGRRLGEIQPVGGPALLRVGGRTVDGALRTDSTAAYSFELPDDWTRQGPIDLTARVNPAGIGCAGECLNRSTFRLTGVPFGTVRVAPIYPIALTDNGERPVSDPQTAFALAQRTTPLLFEVKGYQADVEVGDLLHATSVSVESCFIGIWPCDTDTHQPGSKEYRQYLQGELMDRLEDAVDDRDLDRCDRVPIGLVSGANPQLAGSTRGELLAEGLFPCALLYATVSRPLGSVAHELQHAFSREHAGQGCAGTADGDDQEGVPWPPDDQGMLGGIGLDTTRRTATGTRGPYRILAPGVDGIPGTMFDLMSYCSTGESDLWMSPRGWSELSSWRVSRRIPRPAAPRGQDERLLRVTAVETSTGGLGISGVSPTREADPPGDPGSPYALEALDANHVVLASQTVDADPLAETGGRLITGTVPAPPGTAMVFLRRGNETGTVREASPNPPKVGVRAPRGGAQVSGRKLGVRWRASDPDGGELTATVEFSTNGRSWQVVHIGPTGEQGKASIPTDLLAGSNHARVRVRVDDGFNEDVATSKPFRLAPPRPLVRITDPPGKLTIRADAPLTLRGEAIGAWGEALGGKRLSWFDGGDRLGRGPSVIVEGLRPGGHRITARASQGGATGSASVRVNVQAVKPAFLRLDAPDEIGRRARAIKLKVASTVAATLTAGGRQFEVTPRGRTLTAPVKPGNGELTLRLRLRAGGKTTSQKITVARD
jgi:hypothetical protein